ncbi:MAG: J domain-containing protein [Caulobacterales bacterium]|nr:J domain-containing protein [Caulobacterales bacterium]
MSRAFAYKPRFVDIRIRPPQAKPRPEERLCDWAGCGAPGPCKAPMGPQKLDQFYWFCPAHAAEYNRNWNFFADKSEEEVAAFQESATYGHRPTWASGLNIRARDAAARAKRGFSQAFTDPFGLFGPGGRAGAGEEPARRRRLGRLEEAALRTLGLEDDASGEEVRNRYTELVKRFHPDSNEGDRTSEDRLNQVIRAYQTLKKAGYR